MMVKSVAVVVVVTLVVLGAATETYLAVRENRATLAPPSQDVMHPSPVESTEEQRSQLG